MEKSIKLRNLTINDLDQYKNIRLELLKLEPVNFGSSFEEESLFDKEMWINRLSKEYIIAVGAFDNDLLVGVVLGVMNPRKKIKHIATINSMYVKNEYRKQGIGKYLIEEITKELKIKGVEILRLSVVDSNTSGISLYERLGFITYGKELKSIKLNELYIDLLLMSKDI